MKKYGLLMKFKATEGMADQLASILLNAAKLVANAKGCQLYVVGKDSTDRNAVWVSEFWDSLEDHDQSLHVDGVKELMGRAMPLLDGRPEKVSEIEILGGTGIS